MPSPTNIEWFKTAERNGQTLIFDPVRRKYVVLTPEEKVRQMLIRHLVVNCNMPMGLMAVEYLVKVNNMPKRCDIAVFGKDGSPLVIVECKAESVKIDQSVLDQALRYFSGMPAKYIILSNSRQTFCFSVSGNGVTALGSIPDYNEIADQQFTGF